ncbi:macro domain-containing protein [Bacteroides acidifaciens]|uniref:macro domain-containing protein n=2 Tax=Bacteroides acidifaciens TaxID=85831 RepID=UPI00158E2F64|nr:macro domain-containing protein [Bacteroides acidifaciens]
MLGDIFEYRLNDEYVYNLGTQKDWKTKATLDALRISVWKMLESATKQNITAIAMPKIGAGLGGLVWEDVKYVLEAAALHFPDIDIIVVENYQQVNRI